MAVHMKVDTSHLRILTELGGRKLPYAVVNGLNRTAKDIQKDERVQVGKSLVLRTANTRRFIQRMVAVIRKGSWANVRQGRPYVDIEVGKAERLLLDQYERGEPRYPFVGRNVALPFIGHAARKSYGAAVPKALYVQALGLHRNAAGQVVGAQRTYVVPGVGIYQRKGRRGDRGVLIYPFFKPGRRSKKRLRMVETAKRSAQRYMAGNMDDEVKKALAYGRR